jgi:hypothetical protein
MKKQLKRILIAFLNVLGKLVLVAIKVAALIVLSPFILFKSILYAVKQKDFLSGVQMGKWAIIDFWNF